MDQEEFEATLDNLIEWPSRIPISALEVVDVAKVEAAYRALSVLRDMKHDLNTKPRHSRGKSPVA